MKSQLNHKERKILFRICLTLITTGILLLIRVFFGITEAQHLSIFKGNFAYLPYTIAFLIVYIIIGYDILLNAFRNIIKGTIFDENFLMSIATIGALLIGEYFEAIAVMLFYQIGEFLQNYAVNKSRKSIAELMDIAPEFANIFLDGKLQQVDPYEISIGDEIIVLPGERIPLDGIILDGQSSLNTSALTGESLPLDVGIGDEVYSGSINLTHQIKLKVIKDFDNSTVSRILELVENASDQKAESEVFATTFAKYYTPIVVISALFLALLPPLLLQESFAIWIERALIFLVVSCPCALVVSVPLTFFGGIGAASREGILVKGSNYLEYLSRMKTLVFDKTGTLTYGNFELLSAKAIIGTEDELIEKAAFIESFSTHPIAKSMSQFRSSKYILSDATDVQEIAGKGVEIIYKGIHYVAGNDKLMLEKGISTPEVNEYGTVIHVAENHQYLGYLRIGDAIKDDSPIAVSKLRSQGLSQMLMLSGDKEQNAKKVAEELSLDNYYAELLPDQKAEKLKEILSSKGDGLVGYVGDGLNDAPVLALADIGIAMGGLGSDAAIEAADVVIMQDQPSKIAKAIRISRKTMRIVKQNISFALFVKIGVLLLAILGHASMWLAVFGDVGVTIIAVFNALRVFFERSKPI